MKTNKQGISLIVLVITIIVMIILATAIILSLNSSDIIGKANEAVSKNDIANAKSVVSLAMAEWELEGGAISGYDEVVDYAKVKLAEAGFKTEGHGGLVPTKEGGINTIYVGSDNKQAIIPEGFVASDIKTEDTVTEGLVIYEGLEKVSTDKDAQTTRNQFVWIPVDDITEFIASDGYYEGSRQTYVEDGLISEPCSTISTLSAQNDTTGEYAEYASMYENVEKYNGFYIARYEAGNETNKVVSKKQVTVYANVAWGESMVSVGSFPGPGFTLYSAVELSRSMYNTNSVRSTLIYGVQWDATMNYLSDVNNPNVEGKKYIEDSTGMVGVFSAEEPAKTGSSELGNVKNIYDLAGNVLEWTMEAYEGNNRVYRGGIFRAPSGFYTASTRSYTSPEWWDQMGFRVALYLK